MPVTKVLNDSELERWTELEARAQRAARAITEYECKLAVSRKSLAVELIMNSIRENSGAGVQVDDYHTAKDEIERWSLTHLMRVAIAVQKGVKGVQITSSQVVDEIHIHVIGPEVVDHRKRGDLTLSEAQTMALRLQGLRAPDKVHVWFSTLRIKFNGDAPHRDTVYSWTGHSWVLAKEPKIRKRNKRGTAEQALPPQD